MAGRLGVGRFLSLVVWVTLPQRKATRLHIWVWSFWIYMFVDRVITGYIAWVTTIYKLHPSWETGRSPRRKTIIGASRGQKLHTYLSLPLMFWFLFFALWHRYESWGRVFRWSGIRRLKHPDITASTAQLLHTCGRDGAKACQHDGAGAQWSHVGVTLRLQLGDRESMQVQELLNSVRQLGKFISQTLVQHSHHYGSSRMQRVITSLVLHVNTVQSATPLTTLFRYIHQCVSSHLLYLSSGPLGRYMYSTTVHLTAHAISIRPARLYKGGWSTHQTHGPAHATKMAWYKGGPRPHAA